MARPWVHQAALAVCGAGILVMVWLGLRTWPEGGAPGWISDAHLEWYEAYTLAAGGFFLAAMALVLSCSRFGAWPRRTVPIIVAVGLLARLLVLVHVPVLSTDIFRYVWDGRVQAAGINPYRYLPADPALVPLRDPGPPERPGAIYTSINRADTAPTIYPPFAQFMFAAIGRLSSNIWTMKAVITGFDLLTMAVLLQLLRAAARPDALVLAWAWNPLVIWEFANEGHIDAAAHAFVALALLAAVRGWRGRAGALLAAATLFKLLPITLFPAIWRRWDIRGPAVAAVVILASYAVYASAGLRVFGYLGGYTAEEELFDSTWLPLRLAAAAGLVGAAAWFAFGRPLPSDMEARTRLVCGQALVLAGLLLAAIAPKYPWYYTALLVPGTVVPAWSVLWVTATCPLLYFATWSWTVFPAALLLLFDLYRAMNRPPSHPMLRSFPDA